MASASAEKDFDLVHVGTCGRAELVPRKERVDSQTPRIPLFTVPVGLPPVIPSTQEQLEEFLLHPEDLPINDVERCQRFVAREPNVESLYSVDVMPVQTTIVVDRNPTTGQLLGYKEELITDTGSTVQNSTSLRRPPGPPDQSVKGKSTNYPFWPGGLDEPDIEDLKTADAETLDFENDLLDTPVGLSKGVTFEKKSISKVLGSAGNKSASVLDLTDLLTQADDIDLGLEDAVEKLNTSEQDDQTTTANASEADKENIDDMIKIENDVLTLPKAPIEVVGHYEYAVHVDVRSPVDDFHKRIPQMAYTWPFELDVFQKQAILHLENHDNVFVAAHTSAGKTVVAEYAIALSMKHMTRTVYTSPIKALSNQKFRDFKKTFEDVGLITGDVQIHQEASCLIMTTEILRSMLYNGSDVIRDLEWVIFDEVHYINDAERGVVWEEVLIMLPTHVNIILLSATVPNTMEFADWIGRTKKRKVFVVSTQKRPVPLEHNLYTGNSAKTSNELFCIVDAQKNFKTDGYNKATNAKKERASKASQSFGAKGTRHGGHPGQDKNVWLSLIEMLRKKDQLPVVAFTFSKKKIEENAGNMQSVDLTDQREKSEIHMFFQKSVSRLKGTDRDLPQVQTMAELLKRGIGTHHSGILPILKEVVEMLFGRGLVKVLFATETFAMGVNMPARTVVFDSIRKHDGTNFRDLLPGEYIQMAGRAGRRGLDKTGMVIILCKGDVPELSDLHKMMLGKPTLLQSQFRLTYSMILNLLRVEQLRVEDMMKRSFSEFHNQKDKKKHQESLDELVRRMADMPEVVDYSGDLEQYYIACDEYFKLKSQLQKIILSHPQAIKALGNGRVVIVDTEKRRNTLGVVIQTGPATAKVRTFTTLVLCEQKVSADNGPRGDDTSESDKQDFTLPRPFTDSKLFHPEGPCTHEMLELTADNISVITVKTLKIAGDKIVDECKKRQIPRFRNDPPGQNTSVATQELLRLVEANPSGIAGLDPINDLKLRDMDLVEQFYQLRQLEEGFQHYRCVHDPSFLDNFDKMKIRMKILEQHRHIKYLLSDESLQLLPEYQQRIEVLRQLKYIDQSNTVQLKGRVACEISNHELIITELVFENVLTKLHPTEIAALLSCVVFEQKRCSEPKLAPDLETAQESFLEVAKRIGTLQKDCGLLMPVGDYVEQFHFGLMEVVFEWARGMPFSDITNLTDVQEGIIVRCIQRLDEVLRDVRNAARIIGDPILYQKMEEASTAIKRDIVFAASLYTQ